MRHHGVRGVQIYLQPLTYIESLNNISDHLYYIYLTKCATYHRYLRVIRTEIVYEYFTYLNHTGHKNPRGQFTNRTFDHQGFPFSFLTSGDQIF